MHAARFSQVVERLFGDTPSLDDVVHAQRLAHSLKGSANITGVTLIADVTHQVEDILDWLAQSSELPPPELRDVLLETADCVAGLVDALRSGGETPAATGRVLAGLEDWRERYLKPREATPEDEMAPAAAPQADAPATATVTEPAPAADG